MRLLKKSKKMLSHTQGSKSDYFMGLDEFTTEDEDSSSEDVEELGENEFPEVEQIAEVIRRLAINKPVDIKTKDNLLQGTTEDFAMLFAYMFLEYPDADPYQLEVPDE